MYCQDWTLVKRLHPGVQLIPLYCKCWTCDECRPRRTAQLVREAKAGKPTLFITLTSRNRASQTPEQAAQELVVAWRTIRREYMKEHGKGSLPFLAVFEATKKGWPHLHIVARAKWVEQRWLSKRMRELIGAPVVDVRRVKGLAKVAAYVSKYIGKDPHRFQGTKRYWRSLDFLFPQELETEQEYFLARDWEIARFQWQTVAQRYIDEGYVCEMATHGAILQRPKPP